MVQIAEGTDQTKDKRVCSECGAQGQQQKSGILGMTPLCSIHYDKYNRVLPLIADTELPQETVDARLNYLYRVKIETRDY